MEANPRGTVAKSLWARYPNCTRRRLSCKPQDFESASRARGKAGKARTISGEPGNSRGTQRFSDPPTEATVSVDRASGRPEATPAATRCRSRRHQGLFTRGYHENTLRHGPPIYEPRRAAYGDAPGLVACEQHFRSLCLKWPYAVPSRSWLELKVA